MKLICFLLFLIPAIAFSQKDERLIRERNKLKKTSWTPPNGVWLKDNTFIDQTEIANIHWLEFLFYIEKDSSSDLYQRMISYSANEDFIFRSYLNWEQIEDSGAFINNSYSIDSSFSQRNALKEHYHRYPGFRYFPVVGITYEQALMFCKWRSRIVSDVVNDGLEKKGSNERVYYNFRLPSEEEWELAAYGFLDPDKFPYGLTREYVPYDKMLRKDVVNNKVCPACNFDSLVRPAFVSDYNLPFTCSGNRFYRNGFNFLGYIYDNSPNRIDLYNMIGNVAEMTSEPGLAKGGSWTHAPDVCTIKNKFHYECPNEWIGFRCICDVFVYHKDSAFVIPAMPCLSEDNCTIVLQRESLKLDQANENNLQYNRDKLKALLALEDEERFDIYFGKEIIKKDSVISIAALNDINTVSRPSDPYIVLPIVLKSKDDTMIDSCEVIKLAYYFGKALPLSTSKYLTYSSYSNSPPNSCHQIHLYFYPVSKIAHGILFIIYGHKGTNNSVQRLFRSVNEPLQSVKQGP
jgi:formylglycine-generating enzyme required for sulfatase activity